MLDLLDARVKLVTFGKKVMGLMDGGEYYSGVLSLLYFFSDVENKMKAMKKLLGIVVLGFLVTLLNKGNQLFLINLFDLQS